MSNSSDPESSQRRRRSLGNKSKVGGIAVIVLVGIYSFAAPQLNARFGWNLPQIRTDAQGNVRLADSPRDESKSNSVRDESAKVSSGGQESTGQDRSVTSESTSFKSPPSGTSTRDSDGAADEELLYGLLREISRDRFVSPAGLLYTPGSAEGHRLEHLRRHTADDPGRPGPHGVFDGDMEGALATIDRAYERAKKGQRTTKKVDDGRTIYTVDMGGRVGYVGGREGGRKRNPMARRVRLVLEGNRVITAYPM